MKTKLNLIALFMVCIASIESLAQNSNAIFFTENGERFTLILNGLRQNDKPETNVKITDLNASTFKAKVIFEDKNIAEKNFNVYVEPGSETTMTIKKNNKGEYVLRMVSTVPVAQAPPTPPSTTVIHYGAPAQATQTVTQQTTTTTSSGTSENVSMGINMNVDGQNAGININVSGMDPNMSSSSTTTTTITTTTHDHHVHQTPQPTQVVYVPGYSGPIGCPNPMNPADFGNVKQSISSKSFEDSKLTIAKQVLNHNCMTSAQVKELLGLFDFENTKLDFAKYCYGRTYDIANYYVVNDAFDFESSIDDLNTYINSYRR